MQPMRPRFCLNLPFDVAELKRRLEQRLACERCPCTIVALDEHFQIEIAEAQRHFWSPQLSLQVEPAPDGLVLHGLFGPSAAVWTMFMAAYAALGFGALFLLMLGCSQLLIQSPPWGLWAGGACALALSLPYAGSLVGQRLASEHMELLRCFLQASLGLPTESTTPNACT